MGNTSEREWGTQLIIMSVQLELAQDVKSRSGWGKRSGGEVVPYSTCLKLGIRGKKRQIFFLHHAGGAAKWRITKYLEPK